MTQWFEERYISRAEHQEIVDYYKRSSTHFFRELRKLRAEVDGLNIHELIEHSKHLAEREQRKSDGDNVIRIDFRQN